MDKKSILKIFVRFLWFLFFTAIIITTSVLAYVNKPNEYTYTNDSFNWKYSLPEINKTEYNVVFDSHSHTIYSDGDLTPEQNIRWHMAHGFNAIALTDHNNLQGAIETQKVAREKFSGQFIVLLGSEWTTSRIHMNLIGISEPISPPDGEITNEVIQNAIIETHNQGGIVIVNHIPWSMYVEMKNHPTRQQLLDWGVDYIEVINENIWIDIGSIENWCNDTGGFGSIVGTDMHEPMDVKAWTAMNASEFTEAAILTELQNKNTKVIYNITGGSEDLSVGLENLDYKILEPLIYIGDLFENYYENQLDWNGIGTFTLYMIGVFIISEFLRFGNRRFWERKSTKQIKSTN